MGLPDIHKWLQYIVNNVFSDKNDSTVVYVCTKSLTCTPGIYTPIYQKLLYTALDISFKKSITK